MKAIHITTVALAALMLFACGKANNEQAGNTGDKNEPGPTVAKRAPDPAPTPTDPKLAKGKAVFDESGCATCHSVGGIGGQIGPSLDAVGNKLTAETMKEILRDPKLLNPNTVMPPFEGSEEDLEALVAYLQSLKQGR